jgi:RecA/RadA recombinase
MLFHCLGEKSKLSEDNKRVVCDPSLSRRKGKKTRDSTATLKKGKLSEDRLGKDMAMGIPTFQIVEICGVLGAGKRSKDKAWRRNTRAARAVFTV